MDEEATVRVFDATESLHALAESYGEHVLNSKEVPYYILEC